MRKANIGDAQRISDLLFEAFKEYRELYTPEAFDATVCKPAIIKHRIKEEGTTLVAILEENLVGTVSFVLQQKNLYIRSMAVHPEHRGLKIGGLLLNHLETIGREKRCEQLTLSTTPFLTKAIRLYEKFGFIKTEAGPNDLHGTPLFTMSKTLGMNIP